MYPPPGNPGPSPWGSPPSAQWAPPPPPAQKSSAAKIIGIGCLAVLALACVGGIVGVVLLRKAGLSLGPGREVATTWVTPGAPYALSYVTSTNDDTGVWLDLDLGYAQGVQLTGPVMVRVNGTPLAQYNLNLTSGSCSAPVREVSSSFCVNWRSSDVNGSGSLAGQTRMFKVPAQARGATVTVSGMVFASPGVQVRRLRLFAAQ